jgi:hypothetical protein
MFRCADIRNQGREFKGPLDLRAKTGIGRHIFNDFIKDGA